MQDYEAESSEKMTKSVCYSYIPMRSERGPRPPPAGINFFKKILDKRFNKWYNTLSSEESNKV